MSGEIPNTVKVEAARVKSYFPYRIVFIVETEPGTFSVESGKTMARPNKYLKEGRRVWLIGTKP